ncbi:Aquaporin-4 [Dactylellina cionopaga]|nr:Aquaporin-4 [Dactylellina cionopaga]
MSIEAKRDEGVQAENPADLTLQRTRSTVRTLGVSTPFAARLGGNQEFVLDRDDPRNAAVLEDIPDAAAHMTIKQALDLRGFRQSLLWKTAVMEGVGTMLLVYATGWAGLSPAAFPPPPASTSMLGVFSTASFIGPLVGGITSAIYIAMFIFCFGAVTGGHLNPLITIATFFARLTSLPRTILYVSFQVLGATLAGLLLRASYDSKEFKIGGCWLNPDQVSVSSAFANEFSASMVIIFIAFGVGLDPRQRQIFGPSLGPIFVGLGAGTVIFSMAFTRPGYGGAAVNPARCFGAFVGSRFPSWHWIHWVSTLLASIMHGIVYYLIPPWGGMGGQPEKHMVRPRPRDEEK